MNIDKSIVAKYTSYFHDGSLFAIAYGVGGSELIFTMESAEVDPEDIKDPIPLSTEDRIKGNLHLEGVKSIYVDDDKINTPLTMNYDDGDIFRLEIKDNQVSLHVIWCNYPPKDKVDDCSTIIIHMENTYWENIPDLKDPAV